MKLSVKFRTKKITAYATKRIAPRPIRAEPPRRACERVPSELALTGSVLDMRISFPGRRGSHRRLTPAIRWNFPIGHSPATGSQQLPDQSGGPRRTVGLDWPIGHVRPELVADRRCNGFGRGGAEVHQPAGPVALEPVADVEVLLEVMPEREIEERTSVRGQLHAGREAALDDGEVAGGQVPVQVGHVAAYLEPFVLRQRRRIDPGPGHDDHPKTRDALLRGRERLDDTLQKRGPHAGPADCGNADLFVLAVAKRLPVAELPGIEAGDIAREVVVLLGPLADQRQVGPEPVGDDVLRVPDEDGPVPHA